MRAVNVPQDTPLAVGAVRIPPARVFAEVPTGQAFWDENSVGLVEIAVNRGNAASVLGLAVGSLVKRAT